LSNSGTNNDPPKNPKEVIDFLELENPPDIQEDKEVVLRDGGLDNNNLTESYYTQLDFESDSAVHSRGSLESSRDYCYKLLDVFPDQISKVEMTRKLLEQEIKLQESIRNRDYSDRDITSKSRRGLAYLTGYGCFVIAAGCLGYSFFKQADIEIFKIMTGYSKWLFTSLFASVVFPYYIPRDTFNTRKKVLSGGVKRNGKEKFR